MKVKIIFTILFVGIFIFNNKINMGGPLAQLSKVMSDIEITREQKKEDLPIIERPKIDYLSENKRDPFDSPLKKKEDKEKLGSKGVVSFPVEELPDLKVQGIIWQGRFPQAIINNQILKIGDEIEGVKIVGIERDGVRLLFEDKEYKLSIPIEIIRGGKDEK
ncbi:MAG: general secretion pathway protein GspB [Candidatus Omnitrophica bacterium]|nr:general secretion pathway protein GspB [Candidatus Omnitrophota bacterium]